MPEFSKKFSLMQPSATSNEVADSAGQNHARLNFEQLNSKAKQRQIQLKKHEKIEEKEFEKTNYEVENELNTISSENDLNEFLSNNFPNNNKAYEVAQTLFDQYSSLGLAVKRSTLKQQLSDETEIKSELTTAEKIKNFKEDLTKQGKTPVEILQLLIGKFQAEPAVKTWVENWQNFLRLHQLAQSKPPQERKVIENFIAQADFSSANAFDSTLAEISKSSGISATTKREILQAFDGSKVSTISGLDHGLKQAKTRKKQLENLVSVKESETKTLDLAIAELKQQLDELPLDDPKREEIKAAIARKQAALKHTEQELKALEQKTPKKVAFTLRPGVTAILNPNGSRSLKSSGNFSVLLPSNRLPFQGTKNLRTVNMAFPLFQLQKLGIADLIFRPTLENNAIPSKAYRDMGHFILEGLGFDDTRILSVTDIEQLNKDLARLTCLQRKSGKECLVALGIYDEVGQALNKTRLKEGLAFIKENRGLREEVFEDELKVVMKLQ